MFQDFSENLNEFIVRPLAAIVFSICLLSCAPHRKPIPAGVVPPPTNITAEDEQYGHQVLGQLTEHWPLSRDDILINRVRDIVDRLAIAANAGDSPWHVYVLTGDDIANAGATRGNFIFIWSGMLREINDDAELAVILAHEMGHVLAGHAYTDPGLEANRMISGLAGSISNQVIVRQGAWGGLADLAGNLIAEVMQGMLVRPEEQRKELEADTVGLFLMAKGGYDPNAAIEVWSKVSSHSSLGLEFGNFLSTHPSSDARLENLKKHLPDALLIFNAAPKTNVANQ